MKALVYSVVAVAAIASTIVLFEHSPVLRQVGRGALVVGVASLVLLVMLHSAFAWSSGGRRVVAKFVRGENVAVRPGHIAQMSVALLWFPVLLSGAAWVLR